MGDSVDILVWEAYFPGKQCPVFSELQESGPKETRKAAPCTRAHISTDVCYECVVIGTLLSLTRGSGIRFSGVNAIVSLLCISWHGYLGARA